MVGVVHLCAVYACMMSSAYDMYYLATEIIIMIMELRHCYHFMSPGQNILCCQGVRMHVFICISKYFVMSPSSYKFFVLNQSYLDLCCDAEKNLEGFRKFAFPSSL